MFGERHHHVHHEYESYFVWKLSHVLLCAVHLYIPVCCTGVRNYPILVYEDGDER